MSKISKRKRLIMISSIILILVFISVVLVLIINFNHEKQAIQSIGSVLKKVNLNPVNINQIINKDQIVLNKYKNYNWRIIISKINLDAPILEGTTNEVLRRGVGHFENTGIESGNICLAAHNRGYKYNFFQKIKELDIGDEIIYVVNNMEKKFIVTKNEIIEETDLSIINESNDTKLTLITCEENKKEYRRCIIAKQVNNT